jgi:cytochrome c553
MKILKWFGIILGVLVILAVLYIVYIFISSNSILNKEYSFAVKIVSIPSDSASIAHGAHVAVIYGCTDCHGRNLEGGVSMDNPAMGQVYSPNLTSGEGGLAKDYTDKDWVRAIRHGVGKRGNPLLIMPSSDYYYMSDRDLGDLLAYIKQVPPVSNRTGKTSPGPILRMLLANGTVKMSADVISHEAPRPRSPAPSVTIEYGKYLAVGCTGCHGKGYSGGKIKDGDPSWSPAKNITPDKDTGIGNWTKEDFYIALRDGLSKDGRELDPAMPRAFGKMTNDELDALWLYLQSVSPKPYGNY